MKQKNVFYPVCVLKSCSALQVSIVCYFDLSNVGQFLQSACDTECQIVNVDKQTRRILFILFIFSIIFI